MRFTISNSTFKRMAKAAARPFDPRQSLACVRLEYLDGGFYAITSTSYVMAVEYIEPTLQPNGFVNVPLSIMDHMPDDGETTFEYWPEFKILTAGDIPLTPLDTSEVVLFERWWSLFVEDKKENKTFMVIDGDAVKCLFDASPSGMLTFPVIMNCNKPVIVNDAVESNWCGLFVPIDKNRKAVAAKKPEWMPS